MLETNALRTIRTTLGDNHPDVAAVLNSMSVLCVELANEMGSKQQKVLYKEAQQCMPSPWLMAAEGALLL